MTLLTSGTPANCSNKFDKKCNYVNGPIRYGTHKLLALLVFSGPVANSAIKANPKKSGPGLYGPLPVVLELPTVDSEILRQCVCIQFNDVMIHVLCCVDIV